MQKWNVLAVGTLLVAHGLAGAAGGVYVPTPGVLCDKPSGFCADGTGISASWTEKYLGSQAAHKLSVIMTDPQGFDGSVFTLSNRVHCEIKAKVCTRSKLDNKVEPVATQALFGKLPAAAAGRP